MSAGRYRRTTKKHAVLVEHTDGSESEGFVPVPLGMDFVGVLMQAQGFMQFDTAEGETTFLNVSAIKRITSREAEETAEQAEQSATEKARAERASAEAKRREEEEAARKAASGNRKPTKPEWSGDEYDALEILGLKSSTTRAEIQAAYRKLVKLYHPDRLRGLGVSAKKIEFAAERLSEINAAYRVVMAAEALAA